MIAHVVLLQPKSETSDDEMMPVLDRVQALQQVIPGIFAISTGKNLSAFHSGFTYGVIMHFEDEVPLKAHHPHPAHVAVVEELERLCERIVDFDLPESMSLPFV
jgi:hypothetical protein